MALHANRGRALIGTILATAVGLTAGGVALASTPGSPSAAVAPHVYIASHNGSIRLQFHSFSTIGALNLPAGAFTVTAKAWMVSVAGLGNSAVICKLTLGKASDQLRTDAQDGGISSEPIRNEAVFLTLSTSVSNPSQAVLSCNNDGGGNTDLQFIKITAMKVSGITKSTF